MSSAEILGGLIVGAAKVIATKVGDAIKDAKADGDTAAITKKASEDGDVEADFSSTDLDDLDKDEYDEKMDEYEDEKARLENKDERLREELGELEGELDELEGELAELTGRKATLEGELATLNGERETLVAKLNTLKEEKRTLEAKRKEAIQERDKLVEAKEKVIADKEKEEANLKKLNDEYDQILKDISSNNNKIAEAKEKMEEATQEMESDIKRQVQQTTMKALANYDKSSGMTFEEYLSKQLGGIDIDDGGRSGYIKAVGNLAKNMSSEVQCLYKALGAVVEEIQTSQSIISGLDAAIDSLTTQITAKNNLISDYDDAIAEKDADIADAEAAIDAKDAEIDAKQGEIDDVEGQIKDKNDEITGKKAEITAKEKDIDDNQVLLNDVNDKIKDLKSSKPKDEGPDMGTGDIFAGYLLRNQKYLSEDAERQKDDNVDADELAQFFSGNHLELGSESGDDQVFTIKEFNTWWKNNTNEETGCTAIRDYFFGEKGVAEKYGIKDMDEAYDVMKKSMADYIDYTAHSTKEKDEDKKETANELDVSQIHISALQTSATKVRNDDENAKEEKAYVLKELTGGGSSTEELARMSSVRNTTGGSIYDDIDVDTILAEIPKGADNSAKADIVSKLYIGAKDKLDIKIESYDSYSTKIKDSVEETIVKDDDGAFLIDTDKAAENLKSLSDKEVVEFVNASRSQLGLSMKEFIDLYCDSERGAETYTDEEIYNRITEAYSNIILGK